MSEEARSPFEPPGGGRLGLFEAYGVEIEEAIVDAGTLSVLPACDDLMTLVAGSAEADIELGDVAWSNELALHVLELKTNGPAPSLAGLAGRFHESILRANTELASLGARLMPGGMHPWMDPATETELWPHEYTEVYRAFDRIFGCSGHGWSNVQSTHLNLPFDGDEEFGLLHAAIRLVLPLVPALSAASPFLDGKPGTALDSRLSAYRGNARRVPSVCGLVVPEPAFTRAQYEREILGRIYADLAPLDPEGVLRHEWANARGAIARFDRGTIEIRVMDTQECPSADLAVVAAVSSVVRALAVGPLAARDLRADPPTASLASVLDATIEEADQAWVTLPGLLRALGLADRPRTARDAWVALLDRFPPDDPRHEWGPALSAILTEGPLARRLVQAVGPAPNPERLKEVYSALCESLAGNEPFAARA